MDARLYLITHAPLEPQNWFKVKMPPKPVPRYKGSNGQEYVSWQDAARECGSRHDAGYYLLNSNEIHVWNNEYTKQSCIQWPIAWANAILEQLVGEKGIT